jgi:hypothetical protein
VQKPFETKRTSLHRNTHRFFETPHDRPPRSLLMITAYLDESGHSGNGYAVLAGFYGTDDQWKNLVPLWESGLGARKHLHMTELRWSGRYQTRTRKLLEVLGPIPYRCGLIPIQGAVRPDDYKDILTEVPRERQIRAWTACFFAVMETLDRYCPLHEPIKIVCEMQVEYEPHAKGALANFNILPHLRKNGPRFSGVEFIPKGSSYLTEPGDYLAFAMAHYLENPDSEKATLCLPIMGNFLIRGTTLSRAQIRTVITLARKITEPPKRRK